jgi:predicted metal-dependent enzyme (double-stranded beta helix superfamily)
MTIHTGHIRTGARKLDDFVAELTTLVDAGHSEAELVQLGGELLRGLVATDDWLPAAYAEPDPQRYRQYLLYLDPACRFSVVSFVWGPGQKTPVHNHQVWGLIGVLRGAEDETRYIRHADGTLQATGHARLVPGQVGAVSPRIGDIHAVSNAFPDRVSISVHVYGADIGTVSRHIFDVGTGQQREFVSGYANS